MKSVSHYSRDLQERTYPVHSRVGVNATPEFLEVGYRLFQGASNLMGLGLRLGKREA